MDDLKTRMDNAWLEAEVARLRVESKLHEAMADLFQAERDNLRAALEAEVARLWNAIDDVVCGRGMFGLSASDDLKWATRHLGAALIPAAPPDTTPAPDRPAAPMPAPGSA